MNIPAWRDGEAVQRWLAEHPEHELWVAAQQRIVDQMLEMLAQGYTPAQAATKVGITADADTAEARALAAEQRVEELEADPRNLHELLSRYTPKAQNFIRDEFRNELRSELRREFERTIEFSDLPAAERRRVLRQAKRELERH